MIKKLLSRLFEILSNIPKDKYQHNVLGGCIAAWSFIFVMMLGLIASTKIILVIALSCSLVATVSCALWKDLIYDTSPDWKDIIATIIGGIRIWTVIIVIYLIY